MPMIGGEGAEWAAVERRVVAGEGTADARDPYGLGWVMDWLYGDAVLPPMPILHDPEPDLPWRRQPIHAPEVAPASRRPNHPRRARQRQLVLL